MPSACQFATGGSCGEAQLFLAARPGGTRRAQHVGTRRCARRTDVDASIYIYNNHMGLCSRQLTPLRAGRSNTSCAWRWPALARLLEPGVCVQRHLRLRASFMMLQCKLGKGAPQRHCLWQARGGRVVPLTFWTPLRAALARDAVLRASAAQSTVLFYSRSIYCVSAVRCDERFGTQRELAARAAYTKMQAHACVAIPRFGGCMRGCYKLTRIIEKYLSACVACTCTDCSVPRG